MPHIRGREHSMFERRVHALVTGTILLTVAAVLTVITAVTTTPPWQSFDDQWLAWMVDVRTSGGTGIAKGLSRVGGPTVTLPVRLLVMFGTEFRRLEAAHPEVAARITEAMQARLAGRIAEPA